MFNRAIWLSTIGIKLPLICKLNATVTEEARQPAHYYLSVQFVCPL